MRPSLSRVFFLGILVVTASSLRAEPTNAPLAHPQPPATALAQPEVTGMALGGPVGVLTDQQRVSYFAALKNERARLAELQSKLAAARQDVLVTSVSEKFNENIIRQKALVAARFEAEMAVIRAKVFSQVQPPLSAEQIEKIKTGQPGPQRPIQRQPLERLAPRAPATGTNHDSNGLPPKK